MRSFAVKAAALSLVLAFFSVAQPSQGAEGAQDYSAEARAKARERSVEIFVESEAHYKEGRYTEAARLLREAYAIYPEPLLLYNLGRALEGMGDLAQALETYRTYLREEPEAADKQVVEGRIAGLEKRVAREHRSE